LKENESKSKIGFLELLMMGLGAIIGPSIFVILGYAISMVQSWVFIAFVISGFLFLIISFNYAELATIFPTIGGSYYYAREAYGGAIAYFNGITLWFAYVAYGALSALGFGYIINYVTGFNPVALALIAISIFTVVNIIGVKESAKVQLFLTLLLLITLFILIIGGLINWSPTSQSSLNGIPTFDKLLKASVFVSVSYLGFDVICVMAEKVENPAKTLPKALLLSIILSILVYSLVAFSAVVAVSWRLLAGTPSPLSIVAEFVFGIPGLILVTLSGALATLTTLNSSITTASYVLFSMTKDDYLPKIFEFIHSKYKTPIFAIIFSSISMVLIALSGLIDLVTYIADFGIFVSFALISVSVIALRKKREMIRIFKVPVYPYLPIIGGILCIVFAVLIEPIAVILWLGLMLVALLSYFLNLISIERRKYIISGIMLGEAVVLLLVTDFFKLRISLEALKFLSIIIKDYILFQGIFAIVISIFLMFPLTVFAYAVPRGKGKELIHVPSGRMIMLSKLLDKALVALLAIFVIFNLFIFYGFHYGIVEVIATTEQEMKFFSIFFSLVIIMASISNLFAMALLLGRKYVTSQE